MNPFTRRPQEFKSPPYFADVRVGNATVGWIGWDIDGSRFLIVEAEDGNAQQVSKIAEEIATSLGARFLREVAEKSH